MGRQTVIEEHPREKHEKPPFEERRQSTPGSEQEMRNKPDHGEESYRGYGRLAGKTARITGAASGHGQAGAIPFARAGGARLVFFLPSTEGPEAAGSRPLLEQSRRTLLR